jgi:hypothetical protein
LSEIVSAPSFANFRNFEQSLERGDKQTPAQRCPLTHEEVFVLACQLLKSAHVLGR